MVSADSLSGGDLCEERGLVKYYEAICPKESCLGLVNGQTNWEKGNICIMGVCSKCGEDYLEEDLDWQDVPGRGDDQA